MRSPYRPAGGILPLAAALLAASAISAQTPVNFWVQPQSAPPGAAVQVCWNAPQATQLLLDDPFRGRLQLRYTSGCVAYVVSQSARYVLWVYDRSGQWFGYSAVLQVTGVPPRVIPPPPSPPPIGQGAPPPLTSGRGAVAQSWRDFLFAGEKPDEKFGLYSYVLLTRQASAAPVSQALLRAVFSQELEAPSALYDKSTINVVLVLAKDARNPPPVGTEAQTYRNWYDFQSAGWLMGKAKISQAAPGPFLVVARHRITADSDPQPILPIDLSGHDPDSAVYFLRYLKDQALRDNPVQERFIVRDMFHLQILLNEQGRGIAARIGSARPIFADLLPGTR
jgi:hypothetical protein